MGSTESRPRTAARLQPTARTVRRRTLATWVTVALGLALPAVLPNAVPAAAATGYPTSPPAQICGNAAVLDGPSTAPAGAVRVDPGQNLYAITESRPAGTTFWLAPGTHSLGGDMWAQVIPKNNNVYIGAPGAILDGFGVNRYAFTQEATGVVIKHLTIQNFGVPGTQSNEGVVNHESARGWTIESNTIRNNSGAGVMIGSDNVVRSNCITGNGQYGLSTFRPEGVTNVIVDRNEITANNRDDWEARVQYCGCSGATKFWDMTGAAITNNWIHHNRGSGIWADTNNVGFRIEGNYINDNDGEGIFYEISYNARIAQNTLKRNALVKGRSFAARGDVFPIGAIYLSESGGDARVNGGVYGTFEISDNLVEDNWGGVVLWEHPDRFCGAEPNGYCTKGGAATRATCVAGTISAAPYKDDCRWKTQNVSVHQNDFRMDKAAIGCTTAGCGQMTVMSGAGTAPSWSPYLGNVVQEAMTYGQNNRFANNSYVGDWKWTPYGSANFQSFSTWQSTYFQDSGSTFSLTPGATTTTTASPGTTTTTVPVATVPGNALDAATSTLDTPGSKWIAWFGTAVTVSTDQARTGARSLKVDISGQYWGVAQSNYPGFAATSGTKSIGFSAKGGAGSPRGATMWVHWKDGAGGALRTDSVAVNALSSTWQQASKQVTSPAGTALVAVELTGSDGVVGDTMYIDDVFVADGAVTTTTTVAPTTTTTVAPTTTTTLPPNAANNLLDSGTAGLDAPGAVWVPWFSTATAVSTEQAHSGGASLKVSVNAPYGWGVTQKNWPGFTAAAGANTISFWGRAGSGTGVTATMNVHWRNSLGVDLRTDSVSLTLGPAWVRASAAATAPVGTTRVAVDFTSSTGVPGNTVYLDDIFVGDGTPASTTPTTAPGAPAGNVLDADTAGLEASTGTWKNWFSVTTSSSPEQARSGTRSLKVNLTALYGWGVTQVNFPGYTAGAGPKTISFWGRAGTGSGIAVTMSVHWRNALGLTIRTDTVSLPSLTTTWANATTSVTAPAGTAFVGVDFTNSRGALGNTFYLDDVFVSG